MAKVTKKVRNKPSRQSNKLPLVIAVVLIIITAVGFGTYKSRQYPWASADVDWSQWTKVGYTFNPVGTGYDEAYACQENGRLNARLSPSLEGSEASGEAPDAPKFSGQVYGPEGMAYTPFIFYGTKSYVSSLNNSYTRYSLNMGGSAYDKPGGELLQYSALNLGYLSHFTRGAPLIDKKTKEDNYIVFLYQVRDTKQLVNSSTPVAMKSLASCDGYKGANTNISPEEEFEVAAPGSSSKSTSKTNGASANNTPAASNKTNGSE